MFFYPHFISLFASGVRTVYAMTMFTFALVICFNSILTPFRTTDSYSLSNPQLALMPLILPVVLMNSHKLRQKFVGSGESKGKKGLTTKPLLMAWYAFNLLSTVFYLQFHQASVRAMDREFRANPRQAYFCASHRI